MRIAICLFALTGALGCAAPMAEPVTATPLAAPQLIPSATAQASACTVLSLAPTSPASSLLPPPSPDEPALGSPAAPVTLLYYCDMQSVQCEIFNQVLDRLRENHPNNLRVVMRLFPVPEAAVAGLDKSVLSAQALVAAGNQRRFWEMRDLLHDRYAEWAPLTKSEFRTWILNEASTLGLDSQAFSLDMDGAAVEAASDRAFASATALGISSIPTVFINGRLQERAALTYNGLDSTIGLVALGERQYTSCPAFLIDSAKQYTATLHTEKGDIVISLDAANAPLAVNSFVFLARDGWYDGVSFHRVVPGFIAVAGDPSGTGHGGPGYFFANEVTTAGRFDSPGVVGMVNEGPDTNGSQFFITFAPQPQFDGVYTIFGHVTEGMLVVESLMPRDAQTDLDPARGDRILSVTIKEQ